MVVKVGFAKVGNIATAPLIEFLLDERADRNDIDVRVVSSGAKMGVEQAEEVAKKLLEFKPDFAVVTSPNATLPGPKRLRELLAEGGIPVIVVSDAPAKKIVKKLQEAGFGYIIVTADAMIGARREFLDPVEMALFNADLIKVLAVTGVFNIVQVELDKVIDAFKNGEKPTLPRIVIDKDKAVEAANFSNPYAKAKAMASFEIARRVADLTVEGCFMVKEWERYTLLVAAAHEMMKTAAKLADEARELEKATDSVYRSPHSRAGLILSKRKLIEKPAKPV
ncbi:MAG: methylenetetrahydromethanopterin dehydrogenase [Candidatus Bathyarchaeota archaeon B24]|nr:MAG: methylenetetrahydromethanopterin dehydrogenase [Candidatus Bathyarchaeota archaeon B24]RLI25595.1 MAG: F420-dependent methylenetetrahydromethanopterin dehydrogenase [Candidatus Bathyarchaeota archaeon]